MLALQRGAVSSLATPLFTAATAYSGFLVDAEAVAFQIWDVHDRTQAPVQVYPATPGAWHAVDLQAERLGTGRYVAAWTVPSTAPFGRWQVRWRASIDTLDPANTATPVQKAWAWSRDFDVLPVVEQGEERFALVADLRDEGVLAAVPDWKILQALSLWTKQVRNWLGGDFAPRYRTVKIDSNGAPNIALPEPVIALEALVFEDSGEFVDPQGIRVYNRHLNEENPVHTDRQAPHLEILGIEYFSTLGDYALPGALQAMPRRGGWRAHRPMNVIMRGLWGTTEADGSPEGYTPEPIRRATVMLAQRDLVPLVQMQRRFDTIHAHRATSMRTREQSINFGPLSGGDILAPFSGDPTIDRLLLPYLSGPSVSVP